MEHAIASYLRKLWDKNDYYTRVNMGSDRVIRVKAK